MSTQKLIKRSLKGDGKAQRKLYDEYSSKVMGVCLRYASNEYEADDVFNETWISVFNKLHQFDEEKGEFGGWIYRIAVNSSLASIKSKKKFEGEELDTITEPTNGYDITDDISYQELKTIIDLLPKRQRLIFNLYVIEGYSHKEIAEQMGISDGTSKSQLARARASLQKMINYTDAEAKPFKIVKEALLLLTFLGI